MFNIAHPSAAMTCFDGHCARAKYLRGLVIHIPCPISAMHVSTGIALLQSNISQFHSMFRRALRLFQVMSNACGSDSIS